MSTFDKTVSIIIAIIYNVGAHLIASNTSKELDYNDRIGRTVLVLLAAGAVAVFTATRIKKTNKKRKNLVLAQGLWYAGLMLIVTPLLLIWTGVSNDMKLVLLMLMLGLLVCTSDS